MNSQPSFSDKILNSKNVKLQITNISNPYCWYNDKLGEIIEDAVWFDIWGLYIIKSRLGRHSDDMTIRPEDIIILGS